MFHSARSLAVCLSLAWSVWPAWAITQQPFRPARPEPPQETGFLNRKIEVHGAVYRFQVYLPEEWRRDDRRQWPIILYLHGRGERGSEGMWQTQVGLPQEVRDHPERWPFILVMPQCPLPDYWTDPEMLDLALAALDQETAEFRGDPERTYLTGISMGGYGAWELARLHPQRWAAVAIAASGIFWSYAPERWQQVSTLSAEYANALGRTPVWLFHGADDTLVPVRESELIFEAFRAAGGHIRLWIYEGLKHDCWTRAFNEPDLPRWLLAHHAAPRLDSRLTETGGPAPGKALAVMPALAERLVIPFHPPSVKLTLAQLDSFAGEYCDPKGNIVVTVFRQGDQLYEKNRQGEIAELAAESQSIFFYLSGSATTRLTFERDPQGRVAALALRDDRHEERWERRSSAPSR
jgi:acetyl esterase/lipase